MLVGPTKYCDCGFGFWSVVKIKRETWKKYGTPGGIRTHNPLIRSQMPYPLGHGRCCLYTPSLSNINGKKLLSSVFFLSLPL